MFSGKGAREEAAGALVRAVLSRCDDYTLRKHAAFKSFEILSLGQPAAPLPGLFIRGAGTYSAHVNADNPVGTMQSIEHTLRALDRAAEDERDQLQRLGKTLTHYQAQANRPFEQGLAQEYPRHEQTGDKRESPYPSLFARRTAIVEHERYAV